MGHMQAVKVLLAAGADPRLVATNAGVCNL